MAKPGPKSKYSSDEERYKAQLVFNKKYRQSAKGKAQKQKDDAKYLSTTKGKQKRRQVQQAHSKTDKGRATVKRYNLTLKARQTLSRYWKSPRGRSVARMRAALRRRLIRVQKLQHAFTAQIRSFYQQCPEGSVVDHIIPIIHKDICGLHVPWNFQYLTRKANAQKSNRFGETA